MNKLLYKMPCQSVEVFKKEEIHETLFDKRGDKRYLESSVQKFINLNKKVFDFIGLKVELNGTDNNLTLSFRSFNLIGAIPVKMPYDGIVHKDFQLIPRFDTKKDVFSELSQLLSLLNYSIIPEYLDYELLCLPTQLRPSIYYEALKYIELFEKAYKYNWVKFDTQERKHPFPKTNTRWEKYIESSFDPKNSLIFLSQDSIFTTNHKEWRELKYVLDIAKEQIASSSTPNSIRFKYENRILNITRKVANIKPIYTDGFIIHTSDPQCIKDLKLQANVILNQLNNNCSAWCMDMAKLFEKYVQYIVKNSIKELAGIMITNGRLAGTGNIPSWGLKYLEPDIIIRIGDSIYMADAKYKSHFIAQHINSDILKTTHREDLHQLLAYCSFEPQYNKTGILFYPAHETKWQELSYTDRIGGVCNKVILCGLPFCVDETPSTISKIKKMFQESTSLV